MVFAVAVSCGAAIGIATATGRSDAAMVRRGIAVAGVLLFLGVAAFVALQLWAGSSARAFVFD